MQLDETHIVIRRRTLLEIADLAVHVIRDHLLVFAFLLLVGALPWMIVNYLLVGWMVSGENQSMPGMSLLYWLCMFLLVSSQAQVGTVFITKYLGDATFQSKPKIRTTIEAVIRSLPTLFTLHFLVRPLLFVMAAAGLILTSEFGWIGWLLTPTIVFILLLVRCFRPFVNEIVLLEKTPYRATRTEQVTYAMRTRSLHSIDGENIVGRSLGIFLLAIPVYVIFLGLVMSIKFVFALGADLPWLSLTFLIPASMWLTAGFISVVRFLTYIDTRIYQEGWDVELRIRAEAMKLKERLS